MPDVAAPDRLSSRSAPDPDRPHEVMWNTAAFAALRPGVVDRRLVVDHRDESGRLVGSWIGVVDHGIWISGYSAPFGGLDLQRDHETVDDVAALVARGLDVAREAGCRRVEVRAKPPHFSGSEAHILFALLQAGFVVVESDLNYVIDLSEHRSIDDWRGALRRESRRALRQVSDVGLRVEQLERGDESAWTEAYEVLRRNRVDRGRPMRLELDYVRASRDRFEGLARMTVARLNDDVIAAALVYRVGRGRDLVQYWGDHGHTLTRSPMPLLVEAVVADAIRTGASMVDIGISTDHGEPNLGLMRFKRAMGCRVEPRLTLALDLHGAT